MSHCDGLTSLFSLFPRTRIDGDVSMVGGVVETGGRARSAPMAGAIYGAIDVTLITFFGDCFAGRV